MKNGRDCIKKAAQLDFYVFFKSCHIKIDDNYPFSPHFISLDFVFFVFILKKFFLVTTSTKIDYFTSCNTEPRCCCFSKVLVTLVKTIFFSDYKIRWFGSWRQLQIRLGYLCGGRLEIDWFSRQSRTFA